jgi:cytochrome P450
MTARSEHTAAPGPTIGVRRLAGVAEITGHAEVKAAAKAWDVFSSDLQGDPDVRTYRQLPLEVDPPVHRAYRDLLAPVFGRIPVSGLEPELRVVARGLIGRLVANGSIEAVHEIALPMVASAIGVAFGRRQDIEAYGSWGLETWQTREDGTRDGSHLDAYLERVFDEVSANPGEDVFSLVAHGTIDGTALTRTQMLGVGNLILAGGRDTVIELMSAAIWYLASHADDRARLVADPSRLPAAIEELIRFLSPLPLMERVVTRDVSGTWGSAAAGEIVLLDFASANHDPAVFDAPGAVRLDRSPNPHVGFGNGPHTCIGVHLGRLETRVLLEELLAIVVDWHLLPDPVVETVRIGDADVPTRFVRLPIAVGP